MSRVAILHIPASMRSYPPPSRSVLKRMILRGASLLTNGGGGREGLRTLLGPCSRVGIKINAIAGKPLTTHPRVAFALAESLSDIGCRREDIVIWDRTGHELQEAGYRLNPGPSGYRIFGTDARGVGYRTELTSHLHIGSRFSRIQSDWCDISISLALLKDHGLAGITAGMKNYFGAIHNPNKYHDRNCNPYVAEVFDSPPVRKRHRLTILDALRVQYHRGPAYHPRWASPFGALIFGVDPVAVDRVGWSIVETLRAEAGLPSLQEEGREPVYLATAERMGLGSASLAEIEVIEEQIEEKEREIRT